MLRTLIIDDEPIARDVLRKLLAAHPRFAVTGEAATFDDAATLLGTGDYDVVLLDVQLRGGNGFDLVPFIRRGARTIFVTAYDRYALRAFEVNALDYLLKPVTAARFATALGRLDTTMDSSEQPAPFSADDTILVRTDNGDRFVPVLEISAVLSSANYSEVHLRTGQRLFTRRTMKTWEELLPAAQFARVHRHALVNLACIERHRPLTREMIELDVTGMRTPVSVSRHCVSDVLGRLQSPRG